MKFSRSIATLATLAAVALSGCLAVRASNYGPVELSEKSITLPPGNRMLVGELKQQFRKRGWKMFVDRGPEIEQRAGNQAQRFDTFHTRYRLLVSQRWFDFCLTGQDAISFELSLVDNQTGMEVLAMSGRHCVDTAADRFFEELEKADAARRRQQQATPRKQDRAESGA